MNGSKIAAIALGLSLPCLSLAEQDGPRPQPGDNYMHRDRLEDSRPSSGPRTPEEQERRIQREVQEDWRKDAEKRRESDAMKPEQR